MLALQQVKNLCRRCMLNRFNQRKYNFLRQPPQPADRKRHSLKCRFFRSLLKRRSSEAVFIFMFIVLVTVVILQLNGVTMLDVKDSVGLGPKTIMSISTLDELKDVNFPEGARHHLQNRVVVWKADGFTLYKEQIENNSDVLGRFGKLPSGKKVVADGSGLWIWKNVPSPHGNPDLTPPSIRAFRIAEHVLTKYSKDEIEVAVAVKAYVDGEATLVVKYEDISGYHVHTDRIEQGKLRNKGFCFLILDLPFDKRINTIHIRPTSTNLRRHGIVIIDQVLAVVGNRDATESIIHTFVPKNWC